MAAAGGLDQDDRVSIRVTLQTIADRVGVSRTTVSNAYNRPGELGPELRERNHRPRRASCGGMRTSVATRCPNRPVARST